MLDLKQLDKEITKLLNKRDAKAWFILFYSWKPIFIFEKDSSSVTHFKHYSKRGRSSRVYKVIKSLFKRRRAKLQRERNILVNRTFPKGEEPQILD
jgi:hypothetical protein